MPLLPGLPTSAVFYCFFVKIKMPAKTTFGSSFHFRFDYLVLDFIRNDIHIDWVCGRLLEIWGSEFKNSKII